MIRIKKIFVSILLAVFLLHPVKTVAIDIPNIPNFNANIPNLGGTNGAMQGFANNALSGVLNKPQFSGKVSQIKNLTSQYQNFMGGYVSNANAYTNLLNQFNALGRPANLQGEFLSKAQGFAQKATSYYNMATQLQGQINSQTGILQQALGGQLNLGTSISSLTSSVQAINGLQGILGNIGGQLNSLTNLSAGNLGMLAQIGNMQGMIGQFSSQLTGMQGSIGGILSSLGGVTNISALSGAQISSLTGILNGFTNQAGIIQGLTGGLVNQVGNLAGGAINSAIGGITGNISGLLGQFSGGLGNLGGQLFSAVGGIGGIQNILPQALNGITGLQGLGSNLGGFAGGGLAGVPNVATSLVQPAMKAFNVAKDFKPGKEEPEEADYVTADRNPHEYGNPADGQNLQLAFNEMLGVKGNKPVTHTPAGDSANQVFGDDPSSTQAMSLQAKKGTGPDMAMPSIGQIIGVDMKGINDSAAPPYGKGHETMNTFFRQFVANWSGKVKNKDVLIPRDKGAAAATQSAGADGSFPERGREFNAEDGKETEFYSPQYKSNEEAIQKGACQMIEIAGGKGEYNVIPTKHGKFELAQKGAQDALSVVPERIVDPSHPFSPRHKPEWKERKLNGIPCKGCYSPPDVTTAFCGHEVLIPARAWELQPDGKDYEYYKLPIIVKGGKILATPTRVAEYNVVYQAVYTACMLTIYGNATLCDKIAKYTACRQAILPPETPMNYLKMSYDMNEPINDKMPFIYKSEGKNYEHDAAWAKGYAGLGLAWFFVKPEENFGYNMPPLNHWPTGKPASKPIAEGFPSSEWEYWRTHIGSVNSRFKPSEENSMESGVNNFGCMHGEWPELVMYQANCHRYFGLNCICDYFNTFWRGSAIGYAMFRTSGHIALENEDQTEVKDVKVEDLQKKYNDFKFDRYGQTDYKSHKEKTVIRSWLRILHHKYGEQAFPAVLQEKFPDEPGGEKKENWPGNGAFLLKGLSEAQTGDMIIYDDEEAKDVQYRPAHAAVVERVTEKDGKKCIQVSEANNGAVRDSCENTENWGRVNTRWICKDNDAGATFAIAGAKGLKTCDYSAMERCHEPNWDKWRVYRYKDDTKRATNPDTGELTDGSSCDKYRSEVEKNVDQIRAEQSGGWEDSGSKRKKNPLVARTSDTIKKAMQEGCSPGIKFLNQYAGGRAGGIIIPQFMPTAPGESVSNSDFVNNIRKENKFKTFGDLPRPSVGNDPVVIDYPHAGNNPPPPAKKCGELAIEEAQSIKANTSKNGYTYKDDCSVDIGAPNKPATVCNGKEYGRFGFIYSAYKSNSQITNYWQLTPAQANANESSILAFKNTYNNTLKEPNGCRLTSLSSCAKTGDLVLLQEGAGLNANSPYNRFLLYAGGSSFYEIQPEGTLVRYGPLQPEYASSSYEVRRLSCNN